LIIIINLINVCYFGGDMIFDNYDCNEDTIEVHTDYHDVYGMIIV